MDDLTDKEIKQKFGVNSLSKLFQRDVDWNLVYNIVVDKGWNGLLEYVVSAIDEDGNVKSDTKGDHFCENTSHEIVSMACMTLSMMDNINFNLFNVEYHSKIINFTFIKACVENDSVFIEQLLTNDKFNLQFMDSIGFAYACYLGNTNVVKLILSREDFDPNVIYGNDEEHVLSIAINNDHTDIIRLLLNDERINITNEILENAIRSNKGDINKINSINMLLEDTRINSKVTIDHIKLCIKRSGFSRVSVEGNGLHIQNDNESSIILDMLLNDPRINPPVNFSGQCNDLLQEVIKIRDSNIKTQLLAILLNHPCSAELTAEQRILYNNMLGG